MNQYKNYKNEHLKKTDVDSYHIFFFILRFEINVFVLVNNANR